MRILLFALLVSAIGVAMATPLDAVKNVGNSNFGLVEVSGLNSSVFNDLSFSDDIGNSTGLNGTKIFEQDIVDAQIRDFIKIDGDINE